MQQRQLGLGDILDDYCTRERRLTNHAIVAMVGVDVKQTRCTTCDTEHEYKHAKVPRQRRKLDSPAALYAQVAVGAPPAQRDSAGQVATKARADDLESEDRSIPPGRDSLERDQHTDDVDGRAILMVENDPGVASAGKGDEGHDRADEEGPVHRPLIRASLPREGQPPTARPIPEFTIRQPDGRPARFRPRHQRGGQPFQNDRSNSGGPGGPRSVGPRHGGGRPPQGSMPSRLSRRHGPGRNRPK